MSSSVIDEQAVDALFLEELRDWLSDHLVGEFAAARGVGGIADDSRWELRLEWERLLARDRWLNISWPQEYGGRGGSIRHELLFHIEHARAGAPYWVGSQGRDLFGPTLMAFGTQAQKDRFIPPIVAAEEFWGQGFSEPGAGSDLASLRTSARLEGDRWIIDGQKIWMTFGDHADWLYVLCRTSKEGPQHRGISMLLVPRHQPGVEVRTIRNIAGGAEFCEVFFTGAETAADLVVGEVNQGWKIVMATLGNERGGTTVLPFLASFERQMDDLLEHLRSRRGDVDPVTLDRVVRSWQEYRVLRQHTDRVLGAVLEGRHPGPESSLVKLFWGTWHRDFGELLMEVLGQRALDEPDDPLVAEHRRVWLNSRAETIYGGTVEIQKNIIGERVLGLPR
ncbi:acyl-CoA dehydrogenase family protein [Aeromicrobium sp.]|uniref:acyl-CoA dehydrogenase family protein n=1 Tax=Aeromicrobium sp. TaxID=1871063 RepID=UPI0025B7E83C|nr:acyl-CoA dehydrogenase family protein [Aeromicrobium sp.]MCK5892603.1 acyl-CoA dehydrogenase family protein [Aeromicrobium sp.]